MGNCISKNRETDEDPAAADPDKLGEYISRLRHSLLDMIDTDHGLLGELFDKGALTIDARDSIRDRTTVKEKIEQLLNDAISMTPEQQKKFILALNTTQQKHVGNYIVANGCRSDEHADDWPLFDCRDELDKLDQNWTQFVNFMDSTNGLLDAMWQAGCINERQRATIEAGETEATRNERLLIILRRKSAADYKKFVKCLAETKQCALGSLLDQSTGKVEPVKEQHLTRLRECHVACVALLDTSLELLAKLLSVGCITMQQKKFIQTPASQSERNTRLLTVIRRGSQQDFDKFIECLKRTNQGHMARILMGEGVVVHIVAHNYSRGSRNVKESETSIEAMFADLLKAESHERMVQIAERLKMHGVHVQLIGMKTGHSIGLFFLCMSLDELQHLYDLYSNDELKAIVDEVYELLQPAAELHVDYFVWKKSNYAMCANVLCRSADLPLLSEIYDLAQQTQHTDAEYDRRPRSLPIEQLPFELIEILLMRTTRILYVTLNRTAPRANIYTLVTLSAVARLWWGTLAYRKYNKRQLRRYFRQASRPFICSPVQLTSLHSDDGRDVWGVAALNGRLYVICDAVDTVLVYIASTPFERLKADDIKVEGLIDPRDIVVCSETGQLYIADWQCPIWQVNLMLKNEVVKFVANQWPPWSLSIKSRRLLITPANGDALFIYGDDRVQLNRIQLPDYMKALHAVESSRNTYIVSHWSRYIGDPDPEHSDGISELDGSGRIVRQFNSRLNVGLQFNKSFYLSVDAGNHVIVADYGNKRIVLLKPDLQLRRVLIPEMRSQPERMFLDCKTGLLFVACYYSPDIQVYKVLSETLPIQ